MNPWIKPMKNQIHEPMNQKREEEGFGFREREKVEDWQRKKQKNDTNTNNTNKQKSEIACRAHVADLLCLFFFFFLRLISSSNSSGPIFFPLLFLSRGLGYFSNNQPNLRASRLKTREIETKKDKCHTNTQTNLGFLAR